MKKILFLHGLESKPNGTKPRFLREKGFEVFNPHLPKSSFEESIKIAQDTVYEDSVELTTIAGAHLIPVGNCHRMNDKDALEGLLDAVNWISAR
mgnify:CR=1 FL=1